jgi:DNA-directed RNA polymerase specialized sigma24 family protein
MSKEEAKYKKYETPQPTPTWEKSLTRPDTPYQALMEAAPFQPTDISVVEMLEAKEALADAFDTLTAEEQWVLNSLVIEKMSIRELGNQIGAPKTTMARIRDKALGKMRDSLSDNPAILNLLGEVKE